MARKRTLSDELTALSPGVPEAMIPSRAGDFRKRQKQRNQRPANQSSSRLGSDRKKPKPYSFPGVQTNYDDTPRTNAKGESFITFTRPSKPGMTYHEYTDENGKRRVVGMKRGPKKGLGSTPIGG